MIAPLRAISTGPMAHRAMRSAAGSGHVVAVFQSALWCELRSGMICLTQRGIAPGPSNLTVDTTGDWRSAGLVVGQVVHATPSLVGFGPLRVATGSAQIWRPEPFCGQRLSVGLRRLKAHPRCGLGLGRASWGASGLGQARAWLRGQGTGVGWAHALIGRGEGLTPSGDDALGGIMIALHAVGQPDLAHRLWAGIRAPAQARTNAISFALLAAAAEGLGSAGLHHALNALGRGEGPENYAAGLDAIGHSSGWDAFDGAMTVFEAERARCATTC